MDEDVKTITDWVDMAAIALREAHEATVAACGAGDGPLRRLQGDLEIAIHVVERLDGLVSKLKVQRVA